MVTLNALALLERKGERSFVVGQLLKGTSGLVHYLLNECVGNAGRVLLPAGNAGLVNANERRKFALGLYLQLILPERFQVHALIRPFLSVVN